MKILIAILLSFNFLLPAIAHAQANGSGQKIIIIDSGLATGNFFRNRVLDQWCWSRPSVLTDNGSNPEAKHYSIFSMCNNQEQSDFTSNTAAQIPRSTFHNIDPYYTDHVFGSNHGSTVLGEAAVTAVGARFIVINNSYYDASRSSLDVNGVRRQCGVHGPNGTAMNIQGVQQPSSGIGCYSPHDAERQSQIIAEILSTSNVASINYSADEVASCNLNNSVFRTLKDRNIAFIASAGNEGASSFIGYPACNPNVISVGAVTNDLNSVHPVTSLRGVKLDFLADGSAPNNIGSSTSFAAPVLAAAFAIVQSAENRVRTVNEIKFALEYTSPKCVPTPQGCVSVVTRSSAIEAAECIKNGACRPNLPPGGDDGVSIIDGGQYGPIFGDTDTTSYDVEIDFSVLAGNTVSLQTVALSEPIAVTEKQLNVKSVRQAQITSLLPNNRDIVVNFKAIMTDSFRTRNGIEVHLNNTRIESTQLFNGENEFTYVINRHRFRNGDNIISLRPTLTTEDRLWGVSEISVELNPIVELTVGQTDTTRYGYSETPQRLTGLRASFPLQTVTTDMVFSAVGWDIDTTDEIQVYLNGKSQGFLTQGTIGNTYSSQDTFLLRGADLGIGDNLIELVSRAPFPSGFEREKWAVKNMRIQAAPPDIIGELTSLQDRILRPNKPFSVQAIVRNNGTGSAPATTLRFYLSTNANITTGDTQLTAIPFAMLNEQRTRAVLQRLQTSLVNSGRYIGFCLDAVIGEVTTGNNCSAGVALKGLPNVAPIIMLLLND